MLWAPFLLAFAVACIATPFAIWIAPKIGAMDVPKDDRRVHNKPIPRFGGIAIFAGMMVALATFAAEDKGVPAAMVGCTLIYILGLIDDLKNLKPVVKLSGQVVSAVVVYAMGLRIEFITNYFGPGTVVVLIGASLFSGIGAAIALASGRAKKDDAKPLGPYICGMGIFYIFIVWPFL
jgi:UDP-GlcNAc:undecaprenyl-phosphate/decaprenyl-phosphate GlcNAc-1-phosphate transferase